MAGCKVQGSRTGLQDVPSRSTSTQRKMWIQVGVCFYMEIKAGNCMGGVTSLPVTPGGAQEHLAGKLVTTWVWTQWDTRPRTVVYHYTGEDKADRQTSGRP